MTSAALVHIVLMALVGAVSPVLFLDSGRLTETRGRAAGLRFTLGGALVLVPLGLAMMGLVGASAATFVQRELTSRWVDAALGLVLVTFGLVQAVQARAKPATGAAAAKSAAGSAAASGVKGDALGQGFLGMATNFTTLPVFLSAAQQFGATGLAWWAQGLGFLALVVVTLIPAWLPVVLVAADHSHPNPRAHRHLSPRLKAAVGRATQAVSIGSCLIGGALVLWRAWHG